MPATIDLASLGPVGITVSGADAYDRSGNSASNAGDVNGDGFDDILIGAYLASSGEAGVIYVVFGGPTMPESVDLGDLGTVGIRISGINAGDNTGCSVSSAGDVNGDGFDDLLIGADGATAAGKSGAGQTYVIFGGPSIPQSIDLAQLGASGVTIQGADANDHSGVSVAGAGDVNGDGFDDILIGADRADGIDNMRFDSGESYLLFGGSSLPTTVSLANLGTQGITIYGSQIRELSGRSVSTAGDMNGDGFDDLLIGAYGGQTSRYADESTATGKVYVIFGASVMPAAISLGNPTAGITITGANFGDRIGSAVSDAGDFNGDGFSDIVIGASLVDGVGGQKTNSGTSYVIFGGLALPATIGLATLGSNGITILGADEGDASGYAVSGAGDVNGDGFDDLLIGAYLADSLNGRVAAGISYLIFGQASASATIDLAGSSSDRVLFVGAASGDSSGNSVTNLGDINGDGLGDFLVASFLADAMDGARERAGESYIVFGSDFMNPVFTSNAFPIVLENETNVVTLTSTTLNTAPHQVSYTIVGGADRSSFSLTTDGLLRFVSPADFELPVDVDLDNVYYLRVQADDGMGHTATQDIIVTVLAVNDNAPIVSSPSTFNMLENSTTIGVFVATDADFPSQALIYSITGGADQSKFTISSQGSLTLKVSPDYEIPNDFGADNVYDVQVSVSDGNGRVTTQAITVNITPVNEKLPVFISTNTANVRENMVTVKTLSARDADLPAQTITFSITGGADQSLFTVTSEGALKFATAPDYENPLDANGDNIYEVQVTAHDGWGGTTVQDLVVTVTPYNEYSPVFTSPSSYNIEENISVVGTVAAVDGDSPAQSLTYSLNGGIDDSKFTLDQNGLLSFISPPDFEAPTDFGGNNVYNVRVIARDSGGLSTAHSIAIRVLSVGNDAPIFTSPTSFYVTENSVTIGTVVAVDLDVPEQTVSYAMTGGADKGLFSLSSSGVLTFNGPHDPEHPADADRNNVYLVRVTASDGAGGVTSVNISVNVTHGNLHRPEFISPAQFTVPETTTSVGSAVATDGDSPAQPLTYSITGGVDQRLFTITSEGLIAFITEPDFENPTDANLDNVYQLQVTADDGYGGLTVQSIEVSVVAVNDNVPVFVSPSAFDVLENSPFVGSVIADDPDAPGQLVTYSITGGVDQALFSITSAGVLTFLAPPDFENPTSADTDNVYEVQIAADDGNGGVTIQAITVTVLASNDNLPSFVSPNAFQVPENTVGVGTAIAVDADAPSQTLTYSISGGNDQSLFAISADGTLTFVAAPDFEVPMDANGDNIYELQITVDDNYGGQSVQSIQVSVQPTNDNSPVFLSQNQFEVNEKTTAVGAVAAFDADAPGQTLTFSISGGADRARFAVTSDGIVVFVTDPNFENPTDANADNIYELQIRADDGHGGVAVQDITIAVVDMEELVPELDLGNQEITWIKKGAPARVLPRITVGGSGSQSGGSSLTISMNAIGSVRKLLDNLHVPSSSSLGGSSGLQFENGSLSMQILLNSSVTDAQIQAFLRGITFSTKGRALKIATRRLSITLSNGNSQSSQVSQTINVRSSRRGGPT